MQVITSLSLTFLFFTSTLPLESEAQTEAEWQAFWLGYPTCSQEWLVSLSPSSGCLNTNQCICSNVSWIVYAAQNIGIHCFADLSETANYFYTNCEKSATPMGISAQDFIDDGETAAGLSPTTSFTNPTQSIPTTSTKASI
jgi:hypothetical protein